MRCSQGSLKRIQAREWGIDVESLELHIEEQGNFNDFQMKWHFLSDFSVHGISWHHAF